MSSRAAAGLLLLMSLAFAMGLQPSLVAAQEAPAAAADGGGLAAEDKAALDARVERVHEINERIKSLEARAEQADERTRRVLQSRIDGAWADLADEGQSFAEDVQKFAAEGVDTGDYQDTALRVLEAVPTRVREAIDHTWESVEQPASDASAAEQAAVDARTFDAADRINRFYAALVRNVELSESFGLDVGDQRQELIDDLQDRAENLSVALELTQDDVAAAEASLSLTPDDAEVAAKVTLLRNRSKAVAGQLEQAISLLEELDVQSPNFKKQVIAATGEVNTDVLNPAVAFGLLGDWLGGIGDWFVENGPRLLVQLLLFVAIILAFRFLARLGQKVVTRALDASKVRMSRLLRQMIISVTRGLIMIFGVLVALSQMGISVGPLLAGLGVAGFIVGFALQDTLANFASGLMILFYRPFDVGDLVETGGVFGKVQDMSLVNTTILTVDNQTLVVPNSKIWGDVIKNVTAQQVRRVDMIFGIGYADDIPKAEGILEDIVTHHESVLDDPEPVVKLHELGESSVNFVVRPWVKRDDYWDVYWDITREVKMRFDNEGVSIPFPQRDVHLYTEEAVALAAPEAREALASDNGDRPAEEKPAPSRERTASTGLDADSADAPEGRGDDDGGNGGGDDGR